MGSTNRIPRRRSNRRMYVVARKGCANVAVPDTHMVAVAAGGLQGPCRQFCGSDLEYKLKNKPFDPNLGLALLGQKILGCPTA